MVRIVIRHGGRTVGLILLAALVLLAGGPGFRSKALWYEHYSKHGAEFGNVNPAEYLRMAQELRDAPAGGRVLEKVRPAGVVTRFDTGTGAFLAFNRDGTIRTFFKPNAGVKYFYRQAARE